MLNLGICFIGNANYSSLFFEIITDFDSGISFVSQYHFVFELKSLQKWQSNEVVVYITGRKQEFNESEVFIKQYVDFGSFTSAVSSRLCK